MTFNPQAAIAIMAKQPEEGKTKTRLCPPLLPKEAAVVYQALLEDTISLVSSLSHFDLVLAITPPESRSFFESITPGGTRLIAVEGENLGVCLSKTLQALFEAGYSQAAVINSDGPSLPPGFILRGFELLNDSDLVLGPGQDGGYYMIGMKQLYPELFSDISWSTSRVFFQTLAVCNKLKLRTAVLPAWYDIDTAQDLERLKEEIKTMPESRLHFTRAVLDNLHLT